MVDMNTRVSDALRACAGEDIPLVTAWVNDLVHTYERCMWIIPFHRNVRCAVWHPCVLALALDHVRLDLNVTRRSPRWRVGRRGASSPGATQMEVAGGGKTDFFAAAERPLVPDLIRASTFTHATRRCACPCLSV